MIRIFFFVRKKYNLTYNITLSLFDISDLMYYKLMVYYFNIETNTPYNIILIVGLALHTNYNLVLIIGSALQINYSLILIVGLTLHTPEHSLCSSESSQSGSVQSLVCIAVSPQGAGHSGYGGQVSKSQPV